MCARFCATGLRDFWQFWLGRYAEAAEPAMCGSVGAGGPEVHSLFCSLVYGALASVHRVAVGLLFLFLCVEFFDSINAFGL